MDAPAVGNPFAALSLIVAPAILTNASSVLAMSTSNRLARAVDRARELSRQIEAPGEHDDPRLLRELTITEERAVLLLRVLRSFYIALGAFALATLVSLVGAVLAVVSSGPAVRALEVLGLLAGGAAVGALIHGSSLLIRETRMAVSIVGERADRARERMARRSNGGATGRLTS
jgi:hypothetical protein